MGWSPDHCVVALQVPFSPAPSQFRACALDTHEKMPPHDHRRPAARSYSQRMQPRRQRKADAEAYVHKALGHEETMPHTELSDLAASRLAAQHADEWALLDTYEAHLCLENRVTRAQRQAESCAKTRAFLDGQMHEAEAKRQEQATQRVREREMVHASVAQHEADVARKAAAERGRHACLKAASEAQMREARCSTSCAP